VEAVISVENLNKSYAGGVQALSDINLEIRRGEIFALLGPNGAGKTTLISIICGIVNPTSGRIMADGHDVVKEYRAARSALGLVSSRAIRSTRLGACAITSIATIPPIDRPAKANFGGACLRISAASSAIVSCAVICASWIA